MGQSRRHRHRLNAPPPRRSTATLFAAVFAMLIPACVEPSADESPKTTDPRLSSPEMRSEWEERRLAMVAEQIEARGISDPRVLAAMRSVPRHEFVPESLRDAAYADRPLPIGHGQTISQPYIVATMTELARIEPGSNVLEIGTGSGYQAAVVHEIAGGIRSIEIVEPLAREASETLARLGYTAAEVRYGDGFRGWPEAAPFDAILVTAAPDRVPQPLLDQLAPGGRLVIPVGSAIQYLEVHTRGADGFTVERVLPVRFVPMTGEVRD